MPRLFEIRFITKDSRLAHALIALEGIALGKPEVTSITGAKYSNGKVRADRSNRMDSVIAAISQWPKPIIQRQEISALLVKFGGTTNGVTSIIDRLKGKGLLKGQGTGKYGFKIMKGKAHG